jgi:hypothetical protein
MRRFIRCGVIGLIGGLFATAVVLAEGGASLIQQMRVTGKPALIIAGNESCVYCRQMAAELAGNQDIQPIVRQFFVIKVDTDSSDWPLLQRAFQFDDNGIPAVFVVRGDGKTLYSESGKPRDLGAFLQKQLNSAGAILDADKLRAVQKAVRDARAAIKRHKLAQAVAIVNEHGGTGSFAAAALEIAQITEELNSRAISDANKAEARISTDKQPVQAAVSLVGLRREFAELPPAKEHIDSVWTRLADSEEHQQLMQQAEPLEQAAQHLKDKMYDAALAIYRDVETAAPDSPAGQFARDQIPAVERRLAARSGKSVESSESAPTTGDAADSDVDAKRAASYLKLARVFRNKDPDKARDYLQQAIDAAPDSTEAAEAQKLLDALD